MSIDTQTHITYHCDALDCGAHETVDVAEDDIHRLLGEEHLVVVENLPIGWAALAVNLIGCVGVRTVTACSSECLLETLDPTTSGGIYADLRVKPRRSS